MAASPHADTRHTHDDGGHYIIQVQGLVERHWEREVRMELTYARTEFGTVSTFSGLLPDQAALLGVLGWLDMWGYRLILVRYVPALTPEQHAS